jgi:hypothetical protein
LQFEATNRGLNQPNVAINEKEVFGSRIATRAVIIIDIGGRVRRLLEQLSWEEIKKKKINEDIGGRVQLLFEQPS